MMTKRNELIELADWASSVLTYILPFTAEEQASQLKVVQIRILFIHLYPSGQQRHAAELTRHWWGSRPSPCLCNFLLLQSDLQGSSAHAVAVKFIARARVWKGDFNISALLYLKTGRCSEARHEYFHVSLEQISLSSHQEVKFTHLSQYLLEYPAETNCRARRCQQSANFLHREYIETRVKIRLLSAAQFCLIIGQSTTDKKCTAHSAQCNLCKNINILLYSTAKASHHVMHVCQAHSCSSERQKKKKMLRHNRVKCSSIIFGEAWRMSFFRNSRITKLRFTC